MLWNPDKVFNDLHFHLLNEEGESALHQLFNQSSLTSEFVSLLHTTAQQTDREKATSSLYRWLDKQQKAGTIRRSIIEIWRHLNPLLREHYQQEEYAFLQNMRRNDNGLLPSSGSIEEIAPLPPSNTSSQQRMDAVLLPDDGRAPSRRQSPSEDESKMVSFLVSEPEPLGAETRQSLPAANNPHQAEFARLYAQQNHYAPLQTNPNKREEILPFLPVNDLPSPTPDLPSGRHPSSEMRPPGSSSSHGQLSQPPRKRRGRRITGQYPKIDHIGVPTGTHRTLETLRKRATGQYPQIKPRQDHPTETFAPRPTPVPVHPKDNDSRSSRRTAPTKTIAPQPIEALVEELSTSLPIQPPTPAPTIETTTLPPLDIESHRSSYNRIQNNTHHPANTTESIPTLPEDTSNETPEGPEPTVSPQSPTTDVNETSAIDAAEAPTPDALPAVEHAATHVDTPILQDVPQDTTHQSTEETTETAAQEQDPQGQETPDSPPHTPKHDRPESGVYQFTSDEFHTLSAGFSLDDIEEAPSDDTDDPGLDPRPDSMSLSFDDISILTIEEPPNETGTSTPDPIANVEGPILEDAPKRPWGLVLLALCLVGLLTAGGVTLGKIWFQQSRVAQPSPHPSLTEQDPFPLQRQGIPVARVQRSPSQMRIQLQRRWARHITRQGLEKKLKAHVQLPANRTLREVGVYSHTGSLLFRLKP